MPFSTSDLHGAYRRTDLLRECGRRRLDDALRAGVLRSLWSGVVVEGDRMLDVRTRAAAALLTTNAAAVVCGPTAALLHGCTALSSAETHVLLPYGRSPREATRSRRPSQLLLPRSGAGTRRPARPRASPGGRGPALHGPPGRRARRRRRDPADGGTTLRRVPQRRGCPDPGPTGPPRLGAWTALVGALLASRRVAAGELDAPPADRTGLPTARRSTSASCRRSGGSSTVSTWPGRCCESRSSTTGMRSMPGRRNTTRRATRICGVEAGSSSTSELPTSPNPPACSPNCALRSRAAATPGEALRELVMYRSQ